MEKETKVEWSEICKCTKAFKKSKEFSAGHLELHLTSSSDWFKKQERPYVQQPGHSKHDLMNVFLFLFKVAVVPLSV